MLSDVVCVRVFSRGNVNPYLACGWVIVSSAYVGNDFELLIGWPRGKNNDTPVEPQSR